MVTYPTDWTMVPAEHIVDIGTGCRDTQDNIPHGKYPFFVRSSVVERIDVADYDCEAVLTAGDGVGTGKVFHYIKGKFAAHQRVYVMNNFRGISGKYFYYHFSRNFINEVEKYTAKSSVDSVRRAMIAKMEIPLPSKEEQNAIVSVLESFDAHIINLTELIEKKKAIRDGALEDLMSGRTRLAGFHKEWVPIPFEEYFTLIKNNTYAREQLSEHGSVGNIHYGDILVKFGNIVSDKDEVPRLKNGVVYSEKWLLQEKDVLIADTAEDETVGKAIQIGTMSYPLVGGLHTIVCRPNVQTATGFLGFYINSKSFHDQLLPHITGIKVSSVSKKSIKTTELLIPSDVEEQEAITGVLVSMDDEIKDLEDERNKMIQIREGAMDDLLTGRVRLPI